VALAGHNHLAGVAAVAGDVQGGAGIGWQGTQPGGLGLQQTTPNRIAIFSLPAMYRAIATISAGV
jgi:hypothetical protein